MTDVLAQASPAAPVLLTGATGFLGSHVAASLVSGANPTRLLALRRDASAEVRGGDPAVTVLAGDLRDEGWLSRAAEYRPRAIVHTAAVVHHARRGGAEMHDVNVGATLRMVRLASRARCRMIFVSTSGTVGCSRDPNARPDEDAPFCDAVVSRWPYYASKIEAERRARALADKLGVELVIVRPPVLLGPGDQRLRSTRHIARLLQGRVRFIVPGSIHFVDVRDVSAALVRLVSIPRPAPVYHLPGTSWSLSTFFERCARLGGVSPPRELPGRVGCLLSSAAESISRIIGRAPGSLLPDPVVIEMARHHWGLSSRYARETLGFSPRPADDTLADTVAWLRRHVVLSDNSLAARSSS